jgi:hypothetical protein
MQQFVYEWQQAALKKIIFTSIFEQLKECTAFF